MIWGTIIVGIRTPTEFAIAADGAGTFKDSRSPDNRRVVAKIFEVNGLLYAVGGLTKDESRGFDPGSVIVRLALHRQSLQLMADEVERVVSEALVIELEKLKVEEPKLFQEAVAGENRGTNILLACWENKQPVTIAINLSGVINERGQVRVQTKRLICPGERLP